MSKRRLAQIGIIVALVAIPAAAVVIARARDGAGPAGAGHAADTYVVMLDPAARAEPASGRLVLYFLTESHRGWRRALPTQGPFWDPPQPIASIAVADLRPGTSVRVDGAAVAFPSSIDDLEGTVRVQALLDVDQTERSARQGPGNLLSDVQTVQLRRDAADVVELRLTQSVVATRLPPDEPNLKWIEHRSDLLSDFYGRDVFHRAGVALPSAYAENPDRRWPTIYVTPGYGGRHESAATYADMLSRVGIEEIAPDAVYVVLDPEAPLGHHGFVDSANNGPRGTAFVRELIPHLEREFRLIARPAGRIVTGHSSGGWSSIWLQLAWPDVFGGCWASAPDPVDFRAFQMSNLYEDASLYVDAAGVDRPSLRRMINVEGDMKPVMTVRQECRGEYAVDPTGASGEQWDAWEAMFSPADPVTRRPVPMFDPVTGRIDRAVVDHWAAFDIGRLVESDWPRYGPIIMERVRLSCGDRDSFYLDRAVRLLDERVERLAAQDGGRRGPGYINLVPYATHDSLRPKIFQRVNDEMMAFLGR